MNAFLIGLPYVLVPFVMTAICRRENFLFREYSYLGTGILIFLYPLLLMLVNNVQSPLIPGPLIVQHQFVYFLANTLFFLPLTLLLQLIFNEILLKQEEEWNEIE